jgi:RNA polymerase sigma factor (sigma-70 family)
MRVGTSELDDFEEFYRRTYAAAFRTALGVTESRHFAEDATQEAYCSVYRDRSRFRGDGPAEHWLQRIVIRKAVDQLRRAGAGRAITLTDQLEVEVPESSGPTGDRVELLAALSGLRARQRAAIVLRYFHDYPLRVVGQVLGTSEGGAAMLVQRALANLRRAMDRESETAPAPDGSARADRGGAR